VTLLTTREKNKKRIKTAISTANGSCGYSVLLNVCIFHRCANFSYDVIAVRRYVTHALKSSETGSPISQLLSFHRRQIQKGTQHFSEQGYFSKYNCELVRHSANTKESYIIIYEGYTLSGNVKICTARWSNFWRKFL